MWTLHKGDYADQLERKRIKKGLAVNTVPPVIEDRNTIIWNGWNVLHATRESNGFGFSPLQPTQITAYLDIWGEAFDYEQRFDYFFAILALDAVWVNWSRDQVKG